MKRRINLDEKLGSEISRLCGLLVNISFNLQLFGD